MLILIVKSYDQRSVLIVNSRIQCVSCAQMLKLTLQDHLRINPYPDVYCDRKILHLGVGAQMLTSIVNSPYIQGAYIQGFLQSGVLQSGVLTIRGLTIRGLHQCILHDTSVPSYWYWSLLLTFSGSNERVLHDRSVWFLYSGVLTIRGSYNQGFKWTCITWQVCAQMLILIVKSYDQVSVLIVNFYI